MLPPAVLNVVNALYGPDKWYRVWAMVLTGCLVLCLPKSTRRFGGIALIVVAVACVISHYISEVYIQFIPHNDPPPKAQKKRMLGH